MPIVLVTDRIQQAGLDVLTERSDIATTTRTKAACATSRQDYHPAASYRNPRTSSKDNEKRVPESLSNPDSAIPPGQGSSPCVWVSQDGSWKITSAQSGYAIYRIISQL